MSNVRLVDRSRIVCDWQCPRKRYWQYEHNGRGIVKSSTNLALFTGITVHDSLATIALQHQKAGLVDIDLIAHTAANAMRLSLGEATQGEIGSTDYANEQAALVEGMLRGFYKYLWPRLIAAYPTVVEIEKECEYPITPDILFMSKPDLLLSNDQGELVYIEYKTTSSKKTEWINSWNTAVQLHSSVKAVEHTLGVAPTSVVVVGLYKGYQSYGKQSSPFCYAYKRNGNPPFTTDDVVYEYKAGYKRYPTWELEGGTKYWVDGMPDEVLADLFPMTPPIYINHDLVDAFFRQVGNREEEIRRAVSLMYDDDENPDDHEGNSRILDLRFPQKFDVCSPAYGYGCEYRKLCHGSVVDPLEEGFQPREAHHALEMEQHEG